MKILIVLAICMIFSVASISSAYGYSVNGTMEVSNGYREAAINPNTNTLFVPGDDFSVVNATSLKIIKPLYIESSFSNAIVNEKTNRTYYFDSNIKGGHLHVLDASNREISNISIGLPNYDALIVLNPNTNLIYFQGTDYVVNATSNTAISNQPIYAPRFDMVVDPIRNRLYSTGQDGQIQVFNGSTNRIIDVINPHIQNLGRPSSSILGIYPSATLLYLVNTPPHPIRTCVTSFILTMNLTSKQIIANTTINSPQSFAINEQTGKVYIGSGECSKLTAMDGYSGKLLYTFDGYWQAVVNPKTSMVYAIGLHPYIMGKNNVEAIYDPEKVPEFSLSSILVIAALTGVLITIDRLKKTSKKNSVKFNA